MSDITTNAAEIKRQKINQAFEEIKKAFETKSNLEVEVVEKVKGGFKTIFKEIPIFLPLQQYMGKKEIADDEANSIVGSKLMIKIIDYIEDEFGRVVKASHIAVIDEEKWNRFSIGSFVEGTVKVVLETGLILDVNGIEAFVHISQLSRQRINDINSFAQKGDLFKGEITRIDKNSRRLNMSLKQSLNAQFESFYDKHKVGDRIVGKVRSVINTGVFFELEPNIDGFLRMNEVSWTKRDSPIREMFEVNKEYQLEIIELNMEEAKIGLSHRRLQPDNWKEIADKFEEGYTYSAVIKFIPPNNKGAEISLNDEIDGFVPKQRMQALYNGNKPTFKRGDVIQVKLADRDDERHSLIFESALKPAPKNINENEWASRSHSSSQPISKPEKVHNLTFADLLSASSKKVFSNTAQE